jgi:hypothetical protein
MRISIQLLCFMTLSIVLFLFKTHSVSGTGFCLRLQVERTQLDPIDRAGPYLREFKAKWRGERNPSLPE